MEQAVLAAEAGCESIIPFVHELKVLFEEEYVNIFPICASFQPTSLLGEPRSKLPACLLLSCIFYIAFRTPHANLV